MKTFVLSTTAILLAATSIAPLRAADRPDKKELISQARSMHYSMRREGLDSFQANISVNWEVVLKGQASTPEQKTNALRMLNGLHFGQSFDAAGKSTITHRADVPAPNAGVQAGYDQIFSGMDQAITGFMDTYKLFMVTSPFPETNSAYTLEDASYGYRLTYKDGNSDVTTRMTKDYEILEMIVNSPEFDSSVRPSYVKMNNQFVMNGYEGDYRPAKTKTGVVKLAATIDHTVVDGIRLPSRLHIKSSIDDMGSESELNFSDYIVKKK